MKSLDFYQQLADELIRQDAEKDRMQAAMEVMWKSR